MQEDVEERSGAKRTTKVSSKDQVRVPSDAFKSSSLEAGDVLRVESLDAGRALLTRVEEFTDYYSGALDTQGGLRADVEAGREG